MAVWSRARGRLARRGAALLSRPVRRQRRAARRRRRLHDDARDPQRRAMPVVGLAASRARRRRDLLRVLSTAGDRLIRFSALPVVIAALLALITAGIALDDADPASPLRHLFAIPLAIGALAFGARGAVL